MLCWPFFGVQPTDCRFICNEWEIGIEIDTNVKREEVEKLVNELMMLVAVSRAPKLTTRDRRNTYTNHYS
jgi:hypothetical protein